jgi:UDP-glucose 4-epimerase
MSDDTLLSGRSLVTGAAGFIGTALAKALLARGGEVTVADVRPVAIDHPNARHVVVDVTDRDRLAEQIGGHRAVFHLASNTENRPGHASRWIDFDVTAGGAVALLEALTQSPPAVTVLASSQLVYGDGVGAADELSTPLRPATAFAAAKAAAEAFLCSYAHRTGTRAVCCRLANVIGPGFGRGVVADLATRLRDEPGRLRVLGDGRQRRSFVHVDDCVSALLCAALGAGPGFTALNVSNLDSLTIAEVAKLIGDCSVHGAPEIEFAGGAAWHGDATALFPDAGRLLRLGWKPLHSSSEAVRATAQGILSPRGR